MQLLMALYGYRKAPRLWQDHFVKIVEDCVSVKMRRLKTEPSVFVEDSGKELSLIMHVDDLLFFGDLSLANLLFEELASHLLLKRMGELKSPGDHGIYVGRTLTMLQDGYSWCGGDKLVNTILDELQLQQAKYVATPAVKYSVKQELEAEELPVGEITDYRSSLGKLMYLANDHPDIDFAVNCLARKSSCPTDLDIQRLRRVVRYIRGHPTVKWTFIADGDDFAPELIVYTD